MKSVIGMRWRSALYKQPGSYSGWRPQCCVRDGLPREGEGNKLESVEGREEGNERSSVVLTTNYLLNCGRVSPNQNEITLYPQPNSHYLFELRPHLSDFSHSSPAC